VLAKKIAMLPINSFGSCNSSKPLQKCSKVGTSALNKGFSSRNGGCKELYIETNYSYADANGNMTQDNNKGVRPEIARNT
jgi:hypothetical protein